MSWMCQWSCVVLSFGWLLVTLGGSPAAGQGFYYKEIHKDGRIYIFNDAENAARFEAGGDMGRSITRIGGGPNGETLVADSERALQLYYFKHDISEPVPEPPPPAPPAPPPYKLSGYVFGDYYYFDQDHLPAFDSQRGFWMRRGYFTFDYTHSPRLASRFRLETNSNGKLQGGPVTPFVKDAWLRWNAYEQHQITLGIHPSITFEPLLEPIWGLRHIEKTPLDLYRWDSSRDFGISMTGPMNQKQTIKYAVQYGNDAGTASEIDKYKATRASVRYETNPGWGFELMAMSQQRPRDADRTTGQVFAGYRGQELRAGAHWTYQEREPVSSSTAPETELDIYSAFAIWDIVPKKWSVFARWDIFDDPCGVDCTQIDYLPIDGGQPFDLLIAGVEWYLHPTVRLSPNIEYVMYDDAPAPSPQPKDDKLARLTFYWTF